MGQDHGPRLLPVVIDEIAETDPDRAWASIPISTKLSDGYQDISFRRFANAINRAAWFLETTFGWSNNGDTFAYIGKSDMRYHILSMAAAKTGYQVLFSSHINSLAAHLNLMELCQCKLFLSADGIHVSDILSSRPMNHGICPELDELLDPTPVENFPMPKTFDEAAKDVFLILHSSGTTGLPKPIRITHGYIAANEWVAKPPEGCDCGGPNFRRIRPVIEGAGRLVVPFAPFHVISAIVLMCLTVFGKTTYVFGPPDRGLGAGDLLDAIGYGKANCTFCSPAVLEKYTTSEEDMSRLAKLSTIIYGGGVMSPRTAMTLADQLSHAKLVQFFGATESGLWPLYHLEPGNQDYISVDACHMGIEWRPVVGDSELEAPASTTNGSSNSHQPTPLATTLYEPVIVRFKDKDKTHTGDDAPHQAIFHTFPLLDEYSTGDLFAPHATLPNTWKFAGRADDLILFGHGIKYRPGGVEARIAQSHPWIRDVLMWGDGHQQAVLLVELTDGALESQHVCNRENAKSDGGGEQDESGFKRDLDKVVEEVNRDVPVIAQLASTHVVLVKKDKPLPRTGKGTIRRKEAAKVYGAEIEHVYRVFGDKMGSIMSRLQ